MQPVHMSVPCGVSHTTQPKRLVLLLLLEAIGARERSMILPLGCTVGHSHILVCIVIIFDLLHASQPQAKTSPCFSAHRRPACRLSSRSQRLLASSLPQTGPTVPLPVLAVFPNLDSPGTAERSTFAASAANRHLARVNASCSLSCQRPGSR